MVLTRSQAAKNKANHSPEAHKVTRKQKQATAACDDLTAAAAAGARLNQLLGDKALNAQGMGSKMAKLAKLRIGPSSHPIASLPGSPAISPEPSTSQFTIPAVLQEDAQARQQQAQQQLQAGVSDALASLRAEKLLKPLPDRPIPCDKLPDGPEPVVVEVEYVASQDLQPVNDTAAALESLAPGLGAADWMEAVRTLNLLRQLAAHHPGSCAQQLDQLLPLVLKSVKSLRSSVCKTAIMAVADLYTAYGDALLPYTDVGGALRPATSLLAQLLLKVASNDKKFVVEEAQRALQVLVESLTPAELLPLLLPYADTHKNPRVRGKAGTALADAVARMRPADVLAFGHAALLKVAGKMVTDNTPDARDAAKRLIGLLRAAFAEPEVAAAVAVEAPAAAVPQAEGEEPPQPPSKWEAYCQANLSGSAALAVLKASTD